MGLTCSVTWEGNASLAQIYTYPRYIKPAETTRMSASSSLALMALHCHLEPIAFRTSSAWKRSNTLLTMPMPSAPLTVRAFGDPAPFPVYAARLRRLMAGEARLELAGLRPQTEMSQVLRGLDVIVVPSLW
jgi:hypothetical protein